MELICPKCRGTMRSYERSGITVDQCGECRGIFLDRGEMERLVDAEAAFHTTTAAPSSPAPAYGSSPAPAYGSSPGDRSQEDRYRDRDRDRDDRYRDDRYRDDRQRDDRYRSNSDYRDPRKKKRSFLEDLFD